jgi:hypothetical protein
MLYMREEGVTRQGVDACRVALETHGLLLVQDATLPSVTTITVGEPVRGSWWGHDLAHSIFDVIETLEPEVAVVKLVAKKQTLVHPRLWPALVGVGTARASWQTAGLSDAAVSALELIDGARVPLHPDALGGAAKPATILRELELRLLVMTEALHTESGRHVNTAIGWQQWATDRHLERSTIPGAPAAHGALEHAVEAFGGPQSRKLLPWPPAE